MDTMLYRGARGCALLNFKQLATVPWGSRPFPDPKLPQCITTAQFPPPLIMHIMVAELMHYALCIMRPIRLLPVLGMMRKLCSIRFMHDDIMHYENVDCIPIIDLGVTILCFLSQFAPTHRLDHRLEHPIRTSR